MILNNSNDLIELYPNFIDILKKLNSNSFFIKLILEIFPKNLSDSIDSSYLLNESFNLFISLIKNYQFGKENLKKREILKYFSEFILLLKSLRKFEECKNNYWEKIIKFSKLIFKFKIKLQKNDHVIFLINSIVSKSSIDSMLNKNEKNSLIHFMGKFYVFLLTNEFFINVDQKIFDKLTIIKILNFKIKESIYRKGLVFELKKRIKEKIEG